MSEQPERIGARAPARVPGDPSRLLDVAALRQFVGAPVAVAILEGVVERALAADGQLPHVLITGPDESGKQVLARALARDALQTAIEVDAAWVRDAKHMARILRSLEDCDALLVRRADELRPHALRALVSQLGMGTMPRDVERGTSIAGITLIATAGAPAARGKPRTRLHALERLCAVRVTLPPPCAAAQAMAALRGAVALGVRATPELRAAALQHVTCWSGPGNAPDPAEIAHLLAVGG
jgi:hypothetical protein